MVLWLYLLETCIDSQSPYETVQGGRQNSQAGLAQQATAEEGEGQLVIPCSSVSLPLETFETG